MSKCSDSSESTSVSCRVHCLSYGDCPVRAGVSSNRHPGVNAQDLPFPPLKMKAIALALAFSASLTATAAETFALKYSFGINPVPGFTAVKADETYNVNRTYGFDLGAKISASDT